MHKRTCVEYEGESDDGESEEREDEENEEDYAQIQFKNLSEHGSSCDEVPPFGQVIFKKKTLFAFIH